MAIEIVTTASYFVLVNGKPKGFIKHTRGIKQGDPFHPIYF